MEIILLDWTRMGHQYCLAGVVEQNGQLRVVRPLHSPQRNAPVRNVGWSPFLMDGHSRWENFVGENGEKTAFRTDIINLFTRNISP